MDAVGYSPYICFIVPLILSLFILEKGTKRAVGFIIVGTTICLFVSELNGVLFQVLDKDMVYFCTRISPVTEEIIKALPVLFYAIFFSDDRRRVTQVALAVGLGFAIQENMVIFAQNNDTFDVAWALIRGFGAGLMHSVCTMTVGIGIAFVRKKKKLFYCGTLALMSLAITYHSIYNTIVMSKYKYFGLALPLITYISLAIGFKKIAKEARRLRAEEE
ncbi:MAG: PrsW family intramembrane metalloprotease [Eubacterium sp.]|nr:PrsW family intramembrane metalloprotease [Eubacterium sp.]